MKRKIPVIKKPRVKRVKVANMHCVYLLKLNHPTKNKTYVGSTQNFSKRILQHNGILSGGAKYTEIHSEKHKYQWRPICVISGPKMTKSQSLQFEYRLKHINLGAGKDLPADNGKYKVNGKLVHHRVRKMLIVACLKKWSKKCTVDACEVPLTLEWYQPEEKPCSSEPYLPIYVTEVTVPNGT
jgi:predicted GIY-YIG superfamily endonuclease